MPNRFDQQAVSQVAEDYCWTPLTPGTYCLTSIQQQTGLDLLGASRMTLVATLNQHRANFLLEELRSIHICLTGGVPATEKEDCHPCDSIETALKLNLVLGQFFGPSQRMGSLKRERGVGVQRDAWMKGPEVQESTQSGRFVALPNPSLALQAFMNRK